MKRCILPFCASALMLSLSLVSCSKERLSKWVKPEEPIDNASDRGHDMPNRAEVIFKPLLKADTTKSFAFADDIELVPNADSIIWSYDPNKPGFVLAVLTLEKEKAYQMEINLYNLAGENINYQLITEQQAPMHQFFFETKRKEIKKNVDPKTGKETLREVVHVIPSFGIFKYADHISIRTEGKRNPVGLKGVLYVKDDAQVDDKTFFVLTMAHVIRPNTKINRNSKNKEYPFYPFDKPKVTLMGVSDIQMSIPLKIK